MILAALLLLAMQDAPPPAPADGPDIVVQATYGLTTMLFDKGSDGRLRNCRIMVSSGSQRRDTNACQATPICFAATRDKVPDCVALTAIEPAQLPIAKPATRLTFDMPALAQPKPIDPTAIGPVATAEESRETARQRVKLPPLPKAPTDGPVIRFTTPGTNSMSARKDSE